MNASSSGRSSRAFDAPVNAKFDGLGGEPALESSDDLSPHSLLAGNVFRQIVLRAKRDAGLEISDATAIALVSRGLREASAYERASERTARRVLRRQGWTVAAFVDEVRLRAAAELLSRGFRTDQIAMVLCFSRAATFRRFVRRKLGTDVRALRRELANARSGKRSDVPESAVLSPIVSKK